jgi:hypothetical protein
MNIVLPGTFLGIDVLKLVIFTAIHDHSQIFSKKAENNIEI